MMALNNIKYFECCRGLRVLMLKVLLRCGKAYQCVQLYSRFQILGWMKASHVVDRT